MDKEFKNCPFCGGMATKIFGYPFTLCKCTTCTARVMGVHTREATDQWNTRAPEPAVKALIDAAEKMAAILDHISMAAEQETFDCVEEFRAALAALKNDSLNQVGG